jgi:hypothetical protein
VASVRKMYSWVSDHVLAGTGADIQWKSDKETSLKAFIQLPQFQELRNAIAETSEESEETIEISGTLVGLDVDTRRFHARVEGAEDIKGELSPAIGTKQTLEVPKDYKMDVLMKRKVRFSTETEEVFYFLLKIR